MTLTPDELLSTTRAVRHRLDFTRPVEREVLNECLQLAQQAPSGSNRQPWAFVVVTDADKRAELARIWRGVADAYIGKSPVQTGRMIEGVRHLADHLHEVPVHVIPCIKGRTDGAPSAQQAGVWGSIIPATWSFMLAARSRGLGTVWTTFHLAHEREIAEVLDIPYEDVMQAGLIPVAYTIGTDFKPAAREPLESMVHWNGWAS
jgi:nitroreductase